MDRTTLLEALAHAGTPQDLSRLFGLLGYQPYAHLDTDDVHIVARWRGFQVFATPSLAPGDDARRLARRLAHASHRGLAVAIGLADLALAAPRFGVPGTTPILVVPRARPSALALQVLQELAPRPTHTGLAHALRVAEVLGTERVGDRFFVGFRRVLERMVAALGARGSTADRRTVALVALTRVLFLYFVQAKGWMDGREDYLRALLDDALARRRDFHRDVLAPLFFGTLNRPSQHRSARLRLGRIPYLNGGLFEPHPAERRLGGPAFATALWRDAFDDLFEKFRFCVREADEVDAVAPDTLGRVFERIMDRDERSATGTFYTPEHVVHQVVDAAIETALAGRPGITRETARRVLEGASIGTTEAVAVDTAVRALRILDPALGSGAFLLGALERLTDIRSALEAPRHPVDRCRIRRQVLRDNLFGVDLNPVAVRLAELRLWLAVVADDPTTEIASVEPLPNLDGVLRQGDSLFDPLAATWVLSGGGSQTGSARLSAQVAAARAALFDARGAAHSRSRHDLRAAELDLAERLLAGTQRLVARGLKDLAGAAAGRDLFGKRSRLTAPQRRAYLALRRRRGSLRRAHAALSDGRVPFFSFDVHVPDIMGAGGFSIVASNPPWVRAERLTPDERRGLAARFPCWRPLAGRGFAHQPDLAVAFVERSLELAAPGGAVALLVPSKVASAGYAQALRSHLVRETTLTYVHRVPDREAAAFGATTYPLAIVARKQPPADGHSLSLDFASRSHLLQRRLGASGPWILVPDGLRDAIQQFLEAGRVLREVAPPALGVKTGADALFVGTVQRRGEHATLVMLDGQAVELETDLLKPALRGRDVGAFRAHERRVALWPYRGRALLTRLPPRAAAYVSARLDRLRQRADYRGGPPWTLFRTAAALQAERVVWPDIAKRPLAVALQATALAGAVPLNTCYSASLPDHPTALVVAAVLNSTWSFAAARTLADEARGAFRRINARVAGALPVPPSGPAFRELVDFSAAAHRNAHADQNQLDDAVADAFSLPPAVRHTLRRFAAHHG